MYRIDHIGTLKLSYLDKDADTKQAKNIKLK